VNAQERIHRAEAILNSDQPDWYKAWLEFSTAAEVYTGDDPDVVSRLKVIIATCHKKSLARRKERKSRRAQERLERERALAEEYRCRTPSAWTHTGSPPISRQSLAAYLLADLRAHDEHQHALPSREQTGEAVEQGG
jgi:hypothetical protein